MAALASAGLMAGKGLFDLAGAYGQGESMKLQGKYQREMYESNARLADMQAEDSVRRGNVEANKIRSKGKQVVGSQRVALAAQGIDIESGSAAEVQAETEMMSALDAQTVKNNAWREAWGFQVQANDMRGKGAMAEAQGNAKAKATLITGGMNAIGNFAQAGKAMSGSGFGNSKRLKKYDFSGADGVGGGITES